MNILYCVDNLERAILFNRLANGMREHGLAESRFVVTRLSVYSYLKKRGHNVHWVRKNTSGPNLDTTKTLQVLAGRLSLRKASVFVSSLWCATDSLHRQWNVDLIIGWNGTGIDGPVIRQFSKQHGIKTLFLEVANIPGKIFADPQGTNAQSLLARSPAVLDQFMPDGNEYEQWRESYLRAKMSKHVVPQAKRNVRNLWINANGAIDWLGYLACRRPISNANGLVQRTLHRCASLATRWNYSDESPSDKGYIFYPMQVSSDSQLLVHSKMNNHQGIRQAHDIAQEQGCQLVVKPHPAEFEKGVIAGIHELQAELGFVLTAENTFHLIDQSECVITINSTVGLESLLLGKEVRFLTGGVLPHLNCPSRLAQYVLGYLVDIDYFSSGNSPIPQELLVALLERGFLEYNEDQLSPGELTRDRQVVRDCA